MSIRTWTTACVAAAIAVAAVPTTVGAACQQANMAGTWYALGIAGDAAYGTLSEIDRCKIVVNSGGTVVGTRSSCVYRHGSGTASMNVTGGQLRVSPACAVTGSVRICVSGGCASMRVQHAQMARDKNTVAATLYLDVAPNVVAFYEMVKQ